MATLRHLTSTTLEGAFLEVAFLLQQGELNYCLSGNWKSPQVVHRNQLLKIHFLIISI